MLWWAGADGRRFTTSGPLSTAITFALGTVPARNGRAAVLPAFHTNRMLAHKLALGIDIQTFLLPYLEQSVVAYMSLAQWHGVSHVHAFVKGTGCTPPK